MMAVLADQIINHRHSNNKEHIGTIVNIKLKLDVDVERSASAGQMFGCSA